MPALTQKIVNLDIDKLQPHPENPRQGDIGLIAESIARNGWFGTVIAYTNVDMIMPTIAAGEHRWRALRLLQTEGIDLPSDDAEGTGHWSYDQLREWVPLPPIGKVPVIVRDDWTDRQALAVMLADNKSQDAAAYDDSALSELLMRLATEDEGLGGTLFSGDELDELLRQLDTSVTVPAQDQRTVQERADVYNTTDVRQIVVILAPDEFERAHDTLERAMEHFGIGTHSEAAYALWQEWANANAPADSVALGGDVALHPEQVDNPHVDGESQVHDPAGA